jgi:hypothetical protein
MIPFITNVQDLNNFLLSESKTRFNINYINLKLINNKQSELYNFFTKNLQADIFINDIVFIQENKNKFNYNNILKELNNKVAIVFPLIDNK